MHLYPMKLTVLYAYLEHYIQHHHDLESEIAKELQNAKRDAHFAWMTTGGAGEDCTGN